MSQISSDPAAGPKTGAGTDAAGGDGGGGGDRSTLHTRASLLQRVSGGGDDAWMEFERRYGPLIRGIAHRLGLRGAALDDVAGDAWLDLVRSMPGFDYDRDRGQFRGWLRQVVRRAAWRRWRSDAREAEIRGEAAALEPGSAWEESFEAAWDEAWQRHHLEVAMGRIEGEVSPRDRAIFAAVAVAGRSAPDVATEFGLSVDAVHQVRSRVMRRLRDVVSELVAAESGDRPDDGADIGPERGSEPRA